MSPNVYFLSATGALKLMKKLTNLVLVAVKMARRAPITLVVHGGAWAIPDPNVEPSVNGCARAAKAGVYMYNGVLVACVDWIMWRSGSVVQLIASLGWHSNMNTPTATPDDNTSMLWFQSYRICNP